MLTNLDETVQQGRIALDRMLALFPADMRSEIESLMDLFVKLLDRTMAKRKYNNIASEAITSWRETMTVHDGNEALFGAILLSTLIVSAPDRFALNHFPTEITKEYYGQLNRIALDISEAHINHMTFDNDTFLKDLGICRLEVFPCSALLVEKNSGIPRRLALNNGVGQLFELVKQVTFRGLKFSPYFEIHAHTPMINNFNPEGWDRCYHLVAELLRIYPEYQGLVGGSWFFDPEVQRISPNLAYLRQRAQERGAFFFRIGSTQADVLNATSKSMSRRKLFEEGIYFPTSYLMIWPRKKLLAWSDSYAN